MTRWFNADNLEIKGGRDSGVQKNEAVEVKSFGNTVELVVPFDLTLMTSSQFTYTTDRDNDGTLDGFNIGDVVIPAGAVIESADMYFSETAAGGTSIRFGTFVLTGGQIDNDGLLTDAEGVVANMTVGNKIVGAGAQVGSGLTQDAYIAARAAGTFSAGKGSLVVKYTKV